MAMSPAPVKLERSFQVHAVFINCMIVSDVNQNISVRILLPKHERWVCLHQCAYESRITVVSEPLEAH